MWGPMEKRNVGIFNHIAGDPVCLTTKLWTDHQNKHPTMQSILYSNSAFACDDSLIPQLEKARSAFPHEIQQELSNKMLISFTGKDGIMMESYIMECFCQDDEFDDKDLIRILCIICTSAANAGVSNKSCRKCYRFGCPPNWHDLV